MSSQARAARPRAVRTPLVRLGGQAYFWAWLALFAVGVFTAEMGHGHTVTRWGVLLAPAGAMILVPGTVMLVGGIRRGERRGRRDAGLLAFGLGLIGLGVHAVSPDPIWRTLCLPFLVGLELWLLAQLYRPPSRTPFLVAIRDRPGDGPRGAGWMYETYAGIWLIAILVPFLIAWALDLIAL